MEVLQPIVHYSLHFVAPGLLALLFFRDRWKSAWLIMIATTLVDLDHIYACKDMFPLAGGFIWTGLDHLAQCEQIFVPGRCSIGFHPMHSSYAIAVYFLLLLFPKTRVVAVGLLLHMLTDWQDCFWM